MQQKKLALPEVKPTREQLYRAYQRVNFPLGYRKSFEDCLADNTLRIALECSVKFGGRCHG